MINCNKNREKKYCKIISVLMLLLFSIGIYFSTLNAQENESLENNDTILDIKQKDTVYKFSEDENIVLPFLRFSTDRVEIDREVSNLGITVANNGIDVNSDAKNIQVLISNDTVRIQKPMEYPIILTQGNVIIDSEIDKTVVIFAGQKVTITEKAVLNHDLICFANHLEIQGTVKGNVIGSASNITISGLIEKDLRMETDQIEVADSKRVTGEVYLEITKEDLSIADKYPNAKIKLIQNDVTSNIWQILIASIKSALVYTLAYLLIYKITKESLYHNMLKVNSKHIGFSIISGALGVLSVPLVLMIGFLFLLIGLEEITIPLGILYLAFLLTIAIICQFIIGTTTFTYIEEKYLSDLTFSKRLVSVFFTFLSVILLTNIPKIGIYIEMIYMIIALGIVICYGIKHKEEKESKKKKK